MQCNVPLPETRGMLVPERGSLLSPRIEALALLSVTEVVGTSLILPYPPQCWVQWNSFYFWNARPHCRKGNGKGRAIEESVSTNC